MRFAIIFAGYLIALSIDAAALYENFSVYLLVAVLFVAIWIDIVTLSFDNVEQMARFVEEKKNKTKNLPPPSRPSNGTH